MNVAVLGHTGFIGRSIVRAIASDGGHIQPVSAPRIRELAQPDPSESVRSWSLAHAGAVTRLSRRLEGADVVVNAAGVARPGGSDREELEGANAILVGVVSQAAREAGVRRIVHVSTAAVQGRCDPLDETATYDATTPYARSKMLGEVIILDRAVRTPDEVAVYRPTSVQGIDRSITKTLVWLAGNRLVPLFGPGEQPVPTALVDNVGAAVSHLVTTVRCPPVALHPWEGLTTRGLLEAFGARHFVHLPLPAARIADRIFSRGGSQLPRLEALSRRLELLAFGQELNAVALAQCGYTAPTGTDGYRLLAESIRGGG